VAESAQSATTPPTSAATRAQPPPPGPRKSRSTLDTLATTPALPSTMSVITMRRRTGCASTCSASRVVNPTPRNAECAWKSATSSLTPVSASACAPTPHHDEREGEHHEQRQQCGHAGGER
jgi:hypothetical protein